MGRSHLRLDLHLLNAFQLGDDFVDLRTLVWVHRPALLKQCPRHVGLRAILLERGIVDSLGNLARSNRGWDVPLCIDLVVRLKTSDQL